jgi:hypothetical protein
MPSLDNIKIGSPNPNGANWQFNVRPAEALDSAGIEIVSYPAEQYSEDVASVRKAETDSPLVPVPAAVRWLLKKIIS